MKNTNLLYLLVMGLVLCSFRCTPDEIEPDDETFVDDTEIQCPKSDAVDMGLDVLWAKWNMGETSEFAALQCFGWGAINGNEDYSSLDNFPSPFPPDNISGTEYDIATVKWGEGWRLPTSDDFAELWNNSTISIGEYAGTTYYKIQSEINGNIIYFPLGITSNTASYWTGSLYGKDTRRAISIFLKDESNLKYRLSYTERNSRLCIRPVYEHKRAMTLDATEIKAKSAKLNGEISFLASLNAEEVGFYLSESLTEITTSSNGMRKVVATIENKDIFAEVADLKRNKKYYFRPYVLLDGKSYFGDIKSFMTLNAFEVGELYPDDSNPIGVVFNISDGGLHGKIVSLDQTTLEWQPGIATYVSANNEKDGSKNEFPSNSPIPNWIQKHGSEWYCPAKNELHSLCGGVGQVNKTLRKKGIKPIENFFWASTQYSASYYDLAWIVNVTENDFFMGYYAGWSSYNSKSQRKGVVAIKKF